MIYSTSIRTDLPAFYTDWFIDKLNKKQVGVRNPYYPEKVSIYDLSPDQVDCLDFTSKNFAPILFYMPTILKNYAVICDYTITGYGPDIEPNVPGLNQSIRTFQELSKILGPKRLHWRFDPIFFHKQYDMTYQKAVFQYLCENLKGCTERVLFSFVNVYDKVKKNFPDIQPLSESEKYELLTFMLVTAKRNGLILQTCPGQLQGLERTTCQFIDTSGCITAKMINAANPGFDLKETKAKNNRFDCTCISSKDIGTYDTCKHNCRYCYANSRPGVADQIKCDNSSLLLCDELKPDDVISQVEQKSYRKKKKE